MEDSRCHSNDGMIIGFNLSHSIYKFDDIFILTEKSFLLTKMTITSPFSPSEHIKKKVDTLKSNCGNVYTEISLSEYGCYNFKFVDAGGGYQKNQLLLRYPSTAHGSEVVVKSNTEVS